MKRSILFLLFIISNTFYYLNGSVSAQEGRPTKIQSSVEEARSQISPEESERRLQDAILLFERGKAEAALYALQQLEQLDPTNYKVLFKIGEMAIAAKNWAYSIAVLRKASFLRPEDIPVRLILMDIYKAYQMPIQEIIAGKEILVLEPQHIIALKRLAELYQEQAMEEDEVKIRQLLQEMIPDDYENLKRLAFVLDDDGQYWEAALVYEQIRTYYPDKMRDIMRLAALYGKLQEYFRQHEVLDFIQRNGGGRSRMRHGATKATRISLFVHDAFDSGMTIESEGSDEIDLVSLTSKNSYKHIRIRSSIDLGVQANYSLIRHTGQGVLDGEFDINSGMLAVSVIKNWHIQNYQLVATLGILGDRVSGALFPSDEDSDIDEEDFPFLEKDAFKNAGGLLPVGKLKFVAKPSLGSTYKIAYEHGLINDLDGRLRLFSFDKGMLSYAYQSPALTTFGVTFDASAVSDGNFRLHGQATASYVLWGTGAMKDRYGNRKQFIEGVPRNFVSVGYLFDYYNDRDSTSFYETYDNEIQNEGMLTGQMRVTRLGLESNLYLKLRLSYSIGKTTTSQVKTRLGLFYDDLESKREFGLFYQFKQDKVDPESQQNEIFAGKFTSHTILAQVRFNF